jgi:hypothetical protein
VSSRNEYIRALFQVSKAVHPEVWTKFVKAIEVYTADQIERTITSVPTADALIAVGMVRHMREFRDEVIAIEKLYEKVIKP